MPGRVRDIVIGKVLAPFGIRGEVKVLVLTDFPARFAVGNALTLRSAGGEIRRTVIETSREHKGGLVLRLSGVETRDDVEALRDAEMVIDESELSDLEPDSFYVFDMIGLKVVTDDGREQGEVVEVLQGGANDVYVTSTGLCIPALKEVVSEVDLDKGRMIIHPVPGLLAED